MLQKSDGLSCSAGCWLAAALGGAVLSILLWWLTGMSFLAGLFAGVLGFAVGGAVLAWVICSSSSDTAAAMRPMGGGAVPGNRPGARVADSTGDATTLAEGAARNAAAAGSLETAATPLRPEPSPDPGAQPGSPGSEPFADDDGDVVRVTPASVAKSREDRVPGTGPAAAGAEAALTGIAVDERREPGRETATDDRAEAGREADRAVDDSSADGTDKGAGAASGDATAGQPLSGDQDPQGEDWKGSAVNAQPDAKSETPASAPRAGSAAVSDAEIDAGPDAEVEPDAAPSSSVAVDAVEPGIHTGTAPERLDAPRDGQGDDLTRIKGIGPKLAQQCNDMGIYHFDQIAGWSEQEVAWMDDNLKGFRGRVTRDEWVPQARALSARSGG
ncbi:hypothetical protein [Brevirhabdus sp.]|uniref:hypothetical protein n=1 Tax=Brevirhabdus sp. TaxID=2004514 RepID=UPI004058F5F3